jgi:cytosine/adenosine deaminase-related metal-dependent hydrolase
MTQTVYSGLALVGPELESRAVDIVVDGGRIVAVEERTRAPERWICPSFFNAHTHLGDTIAMDAPARGDIASLVAPPGGLKHRLLAAAPDADCVAGMRESAQRMIRGGTGGFADFREGGPRGVGLLRDAVAGLPCRAVVLGRDGGEQSADGAGIASVRDVADYEAIAERVRESGGIVAFHAGERDAGDVDEALDCRPDLVVHMTHATGAQLRRCADEETPIAVCPRSNWRLGVTTDGVHPPMSRMLDLGCRVLIGTDNAMFVSPDMAGELAFASVVYGLEPAALLRAGIDGAGLVGSPCWIEPGARASFFVVDPARAGLSFSRDPVASLVRRLDSAPIETNVINWKDESIKTIF